MADVVTGLQDEDITTERLSGDRSPRLSMDDDATDGDTGDDADGDSDSDGSDSDSDSSDSDSDSDS